MLSSTSRLIKFLSDKNVDERLEKFLKEQGVNIISKSLLQKDLNICICCVFCVLSTQDKSKMAHLTISIPEELKKKMDLLRVINWSEVAREAFAKRVELTEGYERFQELVSKSKLTEKGAEELARKVNKSIHERLKKLYPSLK